MNVFYLDTDIKKCAEYHCDRHVVKMIVEYTQILNTSLFNLGVDKSQLFYRPTHMNHPSVRWASESCDNWIWLHILTQNLNDEYKFRYDHTNNHLSFEKLINSNLITLAKNIKTWKSKTFTKVSQAMNSDCYDEDSLIAYRKYYNTHKKHLHKWTKREVPYWIKQD